MKTKRVAIAAVAAVAAVTLVGCASMTSAPEPGVQKLGATSVRYNGPEAEIAVSYRFANTNLGEPWVVLETGITGRTGQTVEIKRDKVFLITPDGTRVPLMSQKEFAESYNEMRAFLQRAAIASEPLDYWVGRVSRPLGFFAVPGVELAFDTASVNNLQVLYGPIYFYLPNGLQKGTYQLGIDLTESKIRIPLEITGS